MSAVQANRDRIVRGAVAYAAADKSDPFTFARCMTHINQGLCRPLVDGGNGHYNAEATTEVRLLPDGREYLAIGYRNIQRV
jgi:hypothetical protein